MIAAFALFRALPWRLIGALFLLLALLGAGLWVKHVIHQRDDARAQLAQERTINEQNQKALDEIQAQHAKAMTAMTNQLKKAQARQVRKTTILQEVARAPETHSCGSSPAVTAVLSRLRDAQTPGANPGR